MSATRGSFGSVSPPHWQGETVYLIGGGPSLKGFDLTRLQGKTTVAVNDAVLHAPWATALFSLDRKWMLERRAAIESFTGEKYLAVAEDFNFDNAIPGVTYLLRCRNLRGLSTSPGRIYMGGGNSGYGAFNLAFLKRASRIILLGYDYCQAGQHWFPGYPWQRKNGSGQMYRHWAEQFDWCREQLRWAEVEVLNVSPISLIKTFQKVGLEEVLG